MARDLDAHTLLNIIDALTPLHVLALDLADRAPDNPPSHEEIAAAIAQLIEMEDAAANIASKLERLSPASAPTNIWSFPL